MSAAPESAVIRSSANPLVKALRQLAQGNTAYRAQGRIWIEGDHLIHAAAARGVGCEICVISESNRQVAQEKWTSSAIKMIAMSDTLFASISGLPSPAGLGWVVALPNVDGIDPRAATVVLDRVQDAGNVGAILRSAAAFGFTQVVAVAGTAALWSPKVLRAGMGAHFALRLVEGASFADLETLTVPVIATSSHRGETIDRAELPWPAAWLFGHEGRGVASELEARAASHVRIAQPGGEESLNVASAAAICLHMASLRRPS